MKRIKRYIIIIATGAAFAASLSSCWNKDYYNILQDDEWSNSDFIDDRFLLNGEFDLDDLDR